MNLLLLEKSACEKKVWTKTECMVRIVKHVVRSIQLCLKGENWRFYLGEESPEKKKNNKKKKKTP